MQGTFLSLNPGSDTVEAGQSYTIACTVFSSNAPATPASIALTVRDPQGSSTAPTLSSTATGVYQADVTASLKGRYVYTVATTTPTLVASGEFTVIAKGIT